MITANILLAIIAYFLLSLLFGSFVGRCLRDPDAHVPAIVPDRSVLSDQSIAPIGGDHAQPLYSAR